MQNQHLAALASARQELDKVVKSTTYVVVIMATILLAMVPFFTGRIDNSIAQYAILVAGSMALTFLLRQRRKHLRSYARIARFLDMTCEDAGNLGGGKGSESSNS